MAKRYKTENQMWLVALGSLIVALLYLLSLYAGVAFLLLYPLYHLVQFSFLKFAFFSFVCYPLVYTITILRR